MSENTKMMTVETIETMSEEHTLFGITYKKIGLGVGIAVTAAAVGATGYFLYKAITPKVVQDAVDPVVDAVIGRALRV